jgi:elongation factor Ts
MSATDIKLLRQRTGAGLLDCKKALTASEGDIDGAIDWLRTKGIAKAAKRSGRIATEGAVASYIHAGGQIGVLIEVNCETDFVARTDDFKSLVADLAMHIAAESPQFVAREDVSAADADREREVQLARAIEEGKPANIAEKMVEGRMRKYYEDVCLLEQTFIKDDKKKVKDVVTEAISRMGENIRIRRFSRMALGEGLEKKVSNLAEEVAAQLGG